MQLRFQIWVHPLALLLILNPPIQVRFTMQFWTPYNLNLAHECCRGLRDKNLRGMRIALLGPRIRRTLYKAEKKKVKWLSENTDRPKVKIFGQSTFRLIRILIFGDFTLIENSDFSKILIFRLIDKNSIPRKSNFSYFLSRCQKIVTKDAKMLVWWFQPNKISNLIRQPIKRRLA